MKKLIALLCALTMVLTVSVLAEAPIDFVPVLNTPQPNITIPTPKADIFTPEPEATPTPDPSTTPEAPLPNQRSESTGAQTFPLEVNGKTITLAFDTSPQYSFIEGGLVQASYYGYDENGVTMYELYIYIPESAKEGMVISPEYSALTGEESSVVLIVSDGSSQVYYFSSMMDGVAYPSGADHAIAIDNIWKYGDATTYAGRLAARLIALDMSTGEALDALTIPETPFTFTLGAGDAPVPYATPMSTDIPQDMRKV